MGSQGPVNGAQFENRKIADLHRDLKEQHTDQTTTTDFGTKVHDIDHALKNVNFDGEHVGSHYLEDQIARERVRYTLTCTTSC
jgi:hypothetical protein